MNEYRTHFITNGGDSLDRLKDIPSLNFELFNFSTGYKNIFYSRKFYEYLRDYVRRNEIGLIHSHHRFPELISTRISKILNVKTVTTAHSYVSGFKYLSFRSDRIISVSNSVRNFLIKNYGLSKEKVITIYNPVEHLINTDLELSKKFKEENNITSEKKVLLFAGRIAKDKGYDTLIKSFDLVTKQQTNVVLIIIGQIDNMVHRFKYIVKNKKIILIPPQKNISYLFSISNIVVLPSRIDPFPFVMIESGSMKKPFIGGNTGGIAEFIEDGKNGLLIDPENPGQLAEKINFLLNNPGIGKQLGENLFEKVNRFCDYNNYFSEVEKIYDSLLTC
jgi:glycosyltransferase involved in cell wall biosynthesis